MIEPTPNSQSVNLDSATDPGPVSPESVSTADRVLVAIDLDSPAADLSPVLAMAAAAGWSVDLVHALPPPIKDGKTEATIAGPTEPDDGDDAADAEGTPRREAMARLEAMATQLVGEAVEVRTHVLVGPPVEVLLTAARRLGAAMIVVVGYRPETPGPASLGSLMTALIKVTDRPVLVLPVGEVAVEPGFVAAVDRLVQLIDREPDQPELVDLRSAAEAQLTDPDSEDQRRRFGERLVDALHRFETTHPNLTRAINDVSHHLSGMGI